MSIKYAILGILSWKPSTGYDLKKIIEDSSMMYWSGNNNQIYKSLVQIQDEGLVTSEVVHQDGSPSKKVYTITKEGLSELKDWIMSAPEAPEFKKPFLIRLAWSDQLSDQELNDLLFSYENEIRLNLLLHQEKGRRALNSPGRTAREILLWNMISDNIAASYKHELEWVQEARQKLFAKSIIEERYKMNYQLIENNNTKYIELLSADRPLTTENDALDLIALCGEADTNLLMLNHSVLSEDFFNLKTGVAGRILQKFINYRLKVAAVIPNEIAMKGRFREMAVEANKSSHFRIFEIKEAAEGWLLK